MTYFDSIINHLLFDFVAASFCVGIFLLCVIVSDANLMLMLRTKCGKKIDSLSGKVVWITGASSGIGEHIAYQLSEAGCKLVLSARRKEELERVKQNCLQFGGNTISSEDVLVLPLDVVKFETHKTAVQQVLDYFYQIDILINNAGKFQQARWKDIDLDVDREIFELDVLGAVSLTQAVLPHMMARKDGQIAVISSLAGFMGAPLARCYSGSKHALHGYFDSLRFEMYEHNVDVTIICPGPVVSDIFSHTVGAHRGQIVGNVELEAKKMSTKRFAYLSGVAIANRMYEVWITQNPLLFVCYFTVIFPDFAKWYLCSFGIRRFFIKAEKNLHLKSPRQN